MGKLEHFLKIVSQYYKALSFLITIAAALFFLGWFAADMRSDIKEIKKDVSNHVTDLDTKVDQQRGGIKALDAKIDLLSEEMDAKINHLNKKIDVKIDHLNKKMDAKIDRLDEKMAAGFKEIRGLLLGKRGR